MFIERLANGTCTPRCRKVFVFSLGLMAVLTSLPAHAGESCTTREQMVERLQGTYQEELAGGGLHSDQALVEVWASPDSGSFTVISTDATGLSCILATGTHWQGRAPQQVTPAFAS